MSSKSPCFIKWQPRFLNRNMVKADSHKECVRPLQLLACICHLGLFISAILNGCPIKWQCPVCNSLTILSWFLLRYCSCLAFFAESLLKNCLCPCMDCQCPSCFLLFQFLNTSLETLADVRSPGLGPRSGCEEHNLANFYFTSVNSRLSCTHNVCVLLIFCQFHQGLMAVPD